MIPALISVASVLTYGFLAVLIGAKAYWIWHAHEDVENRSHSTQRGYGAVHSAAALCGFWCGILWPLGLWLVLAIHVVDAETTRRHERADMDAERQRLLAEARKELEAP